MHTYIRRPLVGHQAEEQCLLILDPVILLILIGLHPIILLITLILVQLCLVNWYLGSLVAYSNLVKLLVGPGDEPFPPT